MQARSATGLGSAVRLRTVEPRDLPTLFQYQLDPDANRMSLTRPRDAESFRLVWEKIFADPSVVAQAIVIDDVVVGSIGSFQVDGLDSVGYLIAREHWGKGIASRALALFLELVTVRPLHATVASSNLASLRVLHKCGFTITGTRLAPETDRYLACEEVSLVLA